MNEWSRTNSETTKVNNCKQQSFNISLLKTDCDFRSKIMMTIRQFVRHSNIAVRTGDRLSLAQKARN